MTDPFASVPVSWHAAAAFLLQCVVKNGARKVVGNFNDNSDRTAPDRTKCVIAKEESGNYSLSPFHDNIII